MLLSSSLTACSTTVGEKIGQDQTNFESHENKVCFYVQRVGWHFKEKRCMPTAHYLSNRSDYNIFPPVTDIQTNDNKQLFNQKWK